MGVFLKIRYVIGFKLRLPHARGGVSQAEGDEQYNPRSSPRTWGCFSVSVCFFLSESVFPTHVGVFPRSPCGQRKCSCLPHARGGVSNTPTMSSCGLPSSPRTWGCFLTLIDFIPASEVFPTHVGVFLSSPCDRRSGECLPHARGGVSEIQQEITGMLSSSPRTWGCFYLPPALPVLALVFPTHVGVFPASERRRTASGGLPHARGGVFPLFIWISS